MQRKIVSVVVLMSLLILVVGCTPEATPTPAEPISVKVGTLKGQTGISMIRLLEDNPSLGENVTTEYEVAASPDMLMAKLMKNELDFATIPTNSAAILYNKGAEYKVAGVCVWGVLYVVGEEGAVSNWEDFKGKTVSVFAKAVTPDILFRCLLKENGLDPEKDVTLDYSVMKQELAQAMVAGKAKLAVLPEPFASMVTMKNKDMKVLMNLQEEYARVAEGEMAQTALVVRKEFAEAHPELVDKFMQEFEDSINWVNENPADAGALVEQHEILAAAKMAELAIPRCNLRLENAQQAKDDVVQFLQVLYNFSPEGVGGKMPGEDFFYIKK